MKAHRCRFVHRLWGRCAQTFDQQVRYCSFHQHWLHAAGEPDRYYHQKILMGLCQPAGTVLSPAELATTMRGKYHGDGRRLDQYTDETQSALP